MKTPRFWQSLNPISLALLPFSLLYRLAATLDREHAKPRRAPLPVIAIGNVTAGGAGKTPTTLALIPLLQALGHTPHILTRGYGGANLTAHRVSETDSWQHVGDEALLLAQAAPTWVGSNRLASAIAAAAAGATILLCDDALQHHALHKDITLLVIDGPYGIGNGQLLPAGPLRETLQSAIARCDTAIIIGDDTHQLASKIPLPTHHAKLQPAADTTWLKGKKILAFAGIGRPEKFFTTLRDLGAELVETIAFGDHHAYSESDIENIITRAQSLNAQAITTAKDAVKIPPHLREKIQTLPVALTFDHPQHFKDFLAEKLAALLPS